VAGAAPPPPLGQQRLRALRDGRVALALQRPGADGPPHLVFTPMELLARLVPLIPRPRINLLLYHGVLAPNAPWRRAVVARSNETDAETPAGMELSEGPDEAPGSDDTAVGCNRPRYRAWAELMRRAL